MTGAPRPFRPDADATIAADALPPSSDAATILAGGPRASRPGGRPSTRSSDANSFVGTIDYMSPEVRDGRGAADARSDVFAIGIIAYQLLTGSKPRGAIRPRLPSQIVKGLSPKWDQWIFKCTEQDPGDRFQSAGEALKALPHAGGGGKRGLPLLAIAAGAAALVAAVGAGWFFGIHLPQLRQEREKAVQAENARRAEEERIAAEKARVEAAAKAEAARLEAARGGVIIRTTPPGRAGDSSAPWRWRISLARSRTSSSANTPSACAWPVTTTGTARRWCWKTISPRWTWSSPGRAASLP